MAEDIFYTDLGAKLKAMRRQKKISRDAIAEHFKVGANYIGKIERGESPISAKRLTEWVLFLDGEMQIGGKITVPNTISLQQKTPEG